MKKIAILIFCSISLFAMSIDEVIEEIKSSNPDIIAQKQGIEAQSSERDAKWAQRFGSITLNAEHAEYNINRTLTPLAPPILPNTVTSKVLNSVGATYSVVLFDGFAQRLDVDISTLKEQMEILKRSSTERSLIYSAKSLYLEALNLQSRLNAQKGYEASLLMLRDETKLKNSLGKSSELDLLKIEADLEGAKAQSTLLSENIKILKGEILFLMGRSAKDGEFELVPITTHTPNMQNIEQTEMDSYKIALSEEAKKQKELQNARSGYYPKIKLVGSATDTFAKDESGELYYGGVQASLNLFDFGQRESLIEKAKILHLQAATKRKKTELEITKKIDEANIKISQNRELLSSAKKEYELYLKIAETEKIKLDEGVSTMQDFLGVKSKELASHSKVIEAEHELLNAHYYLDFVTER